MNTRSLKPKKTAKTRADQRLVDEGLANSKEQAKALVLAGEVFSGDRRVEKPGSVISIDAEIHVRERRRFVGRGGEKLKGALDGFGMDVTGYTILDVGSSTGGFTDCLLQAGAVKSYAVDVGRAQLAEKLRNDRRVVVMEQTNARYPIDLPGQVDLVVADVSFISLRLVLPPAIRHLRPGGHVLALVKPQFEAGKEQVGRGGIVRDPLVQAQAVGGFCLWAISGDKVSPRAALRLIGVRASVIAGEKGNQEYFVLLRVS
jgi:23S rRNA (cytidine1920-2'-O)/16S rRNA (cytidine1409-2'-O)-methyltransferase